MEAVVGRATPIALPPSMPLPADSTPVTASAEDGMLAAGLTSGGEPFSVYTDGSCAYSRPPCTMFTSMSHPRNVVAFHSCICPRSAPSPDVGTRTSAELRARARVPPLGGGDGDGEPDGGGGAAVADTAAVAAAAAAAAAAGVLPFTLLRAPVTLPRALAAAPAMPCRNIPSSPSPATVATDGSAAPMARCR